FRKLDDLLGDGSLTALAGPGGAEGRKCGQLFSVEREGGVGETALTLARLHDGPAFEDHARSYGCMWIEPDDGPLAVVGGSAWGNVQVMVPGAGLFWIRRYTPRGHRVPVHALAEAEPGASLPVASMRGLVGKRLACGRVQGETISGDRHWPD